MRKAERVLELIAGLIIGRLLIAGPTGQTLGTTFDHLVDWRWGIALLLAPLLMIVVELIINPHAFD